MRRTVLILCFSLFLVPRLFAQQQAVPSRPVATPGPGAAPQGTPPPTVAPPTIPPPGQQTPRPGGQLPRETPPTLAPMSPVGMGSQNIQLAVTISDSFSSDVQSKKAVTMLIVDGRSGQIRSAGGEGLMNIDARPTIQRDGRILLQLSVEYRPDLSTEQFDALRKNGVVRITMFTESLTLMVPDGKPVVASQSADPRSDRKVALEVTATVVK
jgi:hypothetical protein